MISDDIGSQCCLHIQLNRLDSTDSLVYEISSHIHLSAVLKSSTHQETLSLFLGISGGV